MPDDIITQAEAALEGVTDGPWRWNDFRVPDLMGRAGDPGVYEYDTEVVEASHQGECGCRSACELELTINAADAEFIAAARQLVPALVAELKTTRAQLEQRRIETVEELDALPIHAVVRDRVGEIWEKDSSHYGALWFQTGDPSSCTPIAVHLPAVVLWTPEAK